MSLLGDRRLTASTSEEATRAAEKALEAMVVKQMVAASGALRSSGAAGSAWTADLFAEALADAVTASGSLSLAPVSFHVPTRGVSEAASEPGAPLAPDTARLTSGFGARSDPFTGEARLHRGIDLGAAEGTVIRSALGGEVVRAGVLGGYGNVVEVDHGNGVHTVYAHASKLGVHVGQKVNSGEALGEVGHSGRATGSHLHFEMRVAGKAVNPEQVLKFYRGRDEGKRGGSGSPGGVP